MRCGKAVALCMVTAAAGWLFYCGSFYVRSYLENKQEQQTYDKIREECLNTAAPGLDDTKPKNDTKPESDTKSKGDTKSESDTKSQGAAEPGITESFGVNWKNLWEINPQIVGWITIPGADISYPVVQGEDDEYYLQHSIHNEEDPFGSIFLGSGCDADLEASHCLVYGHNMEGNMMFANLNRYEEKSFWEECPRFYLTTPEKKFCYLIFSVEQAGGLSPAFTYGYSLDSPEYQAQLQELRQNSMYDTGILPDARKSSVSLVTCNSRLDADIRMVVHGICEN